MLFNPFSKALIVSLIIILMIPYIQPSVSSPASLNIPNSYKWLFRPIDTLATKYPLRIIDLGNQSYLYLGFGVYYPIDQIKSYLGIKGDDKIIPIDDALYSLKVPVIIKLNNDVNDISRIIHAIHHFGGNVEYVYKLFPFIAARIPIINVTRLLLNGYVSSIAPDYLVKIRLNESVPMILPPDELRRLSESFGFDVNGSGVVIGVLDTGIDANHPDFYFPNGESKIIYNVSFVPGEDAGDGFGHGTHVAGIAAGTGAASGGVYKGVAPGAYLANIKVMANNGSGYVSWIIKGIEYAINKSIDVINLSLGGGYNGVGDDPLSLAVDRAVDMGVVVVVAAGNEGPNYSSLGSPAVSRKAITVGAIAKNWSLAGFSSRGPTGDLRVKPDVLAPGVDIVAPLAHGSFLEKLFRERYSDKIVHGVGGDYIPLDGTSMATPHVAGLAALILQVHPNYDPETVKSVLLSTANGSGLDAFSMGLGVVNGVDALNTSVAFQNPTISNSTDLGAINIVFRLRELGGRDHVISRGGISLYDFYGPRKNLSSNILSLSLTNNLSPYGESLITLNVNVSNHTLYYGYIHLIIDNQFNLSAVYSIASLPKVVTNITVEEGYLDGIFFAYDKENPNRILLPTGYEYLSGKPFRYYAWFSLPPGNYVFFALGLNYSGGPHNITGPVYFGSRSLEVRGGLGKYYLAFSVALATETYIPLTFGGGVNIPYFLIASFHIFGNRSVTAFLPGTWDIYNDTRCIFSINTSNYLVLNIQYVSVPSLFKTSPYKNIDYMFEYYSFVWKIDRNSLGLVPPKVSTYELDTSSIMDADVMYGGLAFFPPHLRYTYLVITPLYQGGKYLLHMNTVGEGNLGLVAFDKDRLRYRGVAFFDPTTDLSTKLNLLKPPYIPSTFIQQGVLLNGTPYLNITSALVTSIQPTDVIAEGKSIQEIFFNGSLVSNSSEANDFDLLGLIRHRMDLGIYRVHSLYILNYSLYTRVESTVQFDTRSDFFNPPILYKAVFPIIMKEGYTPSLSFLTISGVKRLNIYLSWDGGNWTEVPYTTVTSSFLSYTMTTAYLSVDKLGGEYASLRVYAEDKYGNSYEATFYNFTTTHYLGKIPYNVSIETDKSIYLPGEYVSLDINSDGGLFAFPLYMNNTLLFNVLINGSESIHIPNIVRGENLSIYDFHTTVNYNRLYPPIKLSAKAFYTGLIFKGIRVLGARSIISSGGNHTIIMNIGESPVIRFDVMWMHNNSRINDFTLYLSNNTQVSAHNASLVLSERNIPSSLVITFNNASINIDGTEIYVKNFTEQNITVVWDYINVVLDGQISGRYPVGSNLSIIGNVSYSLLSHPFNGYIFVNGERVPVKNGVFNYVVSGNSIGLVKVSVEKVIDNMYNLTAFKSNTLEILFDQIDIDAAGNYVDGEYIINISLSYLSDGSPVEGAEVFVNGSTASNVGDGEYVYKFRSDIGEADFVITVDMDGFRVEPYTLHLKAGLGGGYSWGTYLIMFILVFVSIILVYLFIKRKR